MAFVPPVEAIDDNPAVCVHINKQWVSYVMGRLEPLTKEWFWEGDDETVYDATQEGENLMLALALGSEVCMTPVGSIVLWSVDSVPDGWLLCDGTAYAPEAYPDLFALIGTVYGSDGGNFRVPNLASRFPLGVGGAYNLGSTGGAETVTLTEDEMPEHGHSVASHHHSIPEHSHTISNHQHTINGHSHNIPAHSHSLSPNPHSHGIETRSNASAFGDASRLANPSGTGTATSRSTLETTLEVSSEALVTAIDGSGVTNLAGGGSTSVQAEFNTNPTGLNTNPTGGGDPHNNMPPYLALNYIIRAN